MTRDWNADGFPDYADHEHRVHQIERRLDSLRDRVRDIEEKVRKVEAECAEWGPIIATARDQEYLRAWIERQERKELAKRELRWTHVLGVLGLLAAWTAGVAAIVGLLLKHSGHL